MAKTGSGSEGSSPNCPLLVPESRPAFLAMDTQTLSLARKWRPQTFADLVGHEYTARVLQNAVHQNRLHHAFLFTGTRGVGKTTLARIVAKTVNCEQPKDGAPCLECDMCRQIAEGRMLDVVELDAASHTQVDKMRELLEGAKYPPAQGACKVFIIDEAHMLSKSAFAAMLKTLEEPPGYLKFVLATTDPQKLPPTIMSRCLCFALRPLERAQIAARLAHILDAEKREYSDAAVQAVARLARGSMRDALSILEQAMSHGEGKLEADAVRRIVGEADFALIAEILEAVAAADASAISKFAHRLTAESAGFDAALSSMAAMLYKAALSKATPGAADDPEEAAAIEKVSPLFKDEELQVLYEIAVRGRKQLPWAPDEQTGFEMTLLRMALFAPNKSHADTGSVSAGAPAPKASESVESPPSAAPAAKPPHASASGANGGGIEERWCQTMSRLSGNAKAHAEVCKVVSMDDDSVKLRIDKSAAATAHLFLPSLEKQLREIFHNDFKVELVEGEDDSAAAAHQEMEKQTAASRPFVREMLEAMPSAVIVPNSIVLHKNGNSN